MQDFLEVGQIVNTHGLRGEVKVIPLTDYPERFEELNKVYVKNKELIIQNVRYQNKFILLTFKDHIAIDDVLRYKGEYLLIKRTDALNLPEGTYFIADMIGIQVYNTNGELLGKIIDIFATGSNDVYVIQNEGKQILVPALKDVIQEVDIYNQKMTVKLLEGLDWYEI